MATPRSVTLDAHGLRIDDASVPLVAGTIEFWRINSLHWERCLDQLIRAGLGQVSSFVCWDHHVTTDGLDFTGRTHPSRDLAGFIDLCAARGLDFLLRLGPIIDAEWPTRGPAEEVCQLERTDPRFREATARYVRSVAEVVVPRLATRGGNVILVNVDNEVFYPYATDEEADPSEGSLPVPYDRDRVLADYRAWLATRYASDAELRAAWNAPEVSLAGAVEPAFATASPVELRDAFDFVTDTVVDHYRWLTGVARGAGIDVPIYSNMKQFTHHIDWSEVEEVVDSHGAVVFFPNLPTGEVALAFSWYVRMMAAQTRLPWAAEMQSEASPGQDDVFGVIDDRHHRYLTELGLAIGLRALSYYVFVERDDSVYAPVSPIGKWRPRADQLAKAIDMAKHVTPDGRHLRDVALLWSIDHYRMHVATRNDTWTHLGASIWIDFDDKELPTWWGAFTALHAADVDFDVVTMRSDRTAPVLVYAGPLIVRTSDWAAVAARVADGAQLVAEELPSRSLDLDQAGLERINDELRRSGRVIAWDGEGASLPVVLSEAGARGALTSGTPDVWTSAYVSGARLELFVANTARESRDVRPVIGPALLDRLAGAVARDHASGETWVVPGQALHPDGFALAGNEVRMILVEDGAV